MADLVCDRLMGGESLRAICAEKSTPSRVTILKWLGDYPQFAAQYARAREIQADTLADEILVLADKSRTGKIVTDKADGTREVKTADMVERTRLQIDARKWFASKLAPKKYGDRTAIEHSGNIGTGNPEDLTDEQIAERLQRLSAMRNAGA
ncbi:MAG: hypothetical protein KGL20_05130 [Rhodospirillales bacterium]|nr:hypothetical protein [Rhodospirillales bacterium]